MHDPKRLQAIFEETIPASTVAGMPSFRPMFGGVLGYLDGRAWASFSNVGLAIKIAPKEQEEFLAIPGTDRLRYEPSDPPSKQYLLVPEAWLVAGDSNLAAWIRRSGDYVRTLPEPKKKAKA